MRNPFDRAVSDYLWRTRKTGNTSLSFGDFLDRLDRRDFTSRTIPRHFDNWPIYTVDNRIAVDFVGRYERLDEDLDRVFDRLGLERGSLARSKSMQRQGSYRDWYGEDERNRVENLFANEIRQFQYSF